MAKTFFLQCSHGPRSPNVCQHGYTCENMCCNQIKYKQNPTCIRFGVYPAPNGPMQLGLICNNADMVCYTLFLVCN